MVDYRSSDAALAGGLESGMRMGLLGLQMRQQKQQKLQQEYEQDYKKFKTTTDFLDSKVGKNLPGATKVGLYNNIVIPFFNKYSPEVPLQKIGSWEELTPDFMTKLKAIDEASDDRDFKIGALTDLLAEAETAREEAAVKGKIGQLEGQKKQQASFRQGEIQAQTLGISPDDPRYVGMIEGDEDTRKVIAGQLKPDDNATASLREFETVKGIPSTMRGTPQYQRAYENWLRLKNPGAGSGNVVIVPTAEGFMQVNKQTGMASPVTTATGAGVGKPLTGEMITTEQQIGTVKDVFERVKTLYNDAYTGPAQGRWGSIKSLTVGNSPEQAQFISDLQDLNNTLVYLKSGKQINEQEYARLKAAMPHLNLADSDFKARMSAFEKTLNSIITERQKNMGGYGKGGGAKSNLKQKYGLE